MNGYKPSTPRAALGMTAVAMAAITLAALVVLPAKLEFVRVDPYTLAAAKAATKAPIDVAITPTRINAPESLNREEHLHSDRAVLGAQEFRGKREQLSSRSRIHS